MWVERGERGIVGHHDLIKHKGNFPSPVKGMNMAHWLSAARSTENELVGILARTDLDPGQRAKMDVLLLQVRKFLAKQLDRLNLAPLPVEGLPKPLLGLLG